VTRPTIHSNPLPYTSSLQARLSASVELAVIHCTELPDLATEREFGERILYPESGTGNSGHYYIERSGRIEEWVSPQRVAHHARGYNARSVGIELDNVGRFPNWLDSRCQLMTQAYPSAQIDALIRLLRELTKVLPALRWITGHETLDTARVPATDDPQLLVFRKLDPGPMFPWPTLLEDIGLQYLQGESLAAFRSD
jgi:N-acetylmuramoyl-L-alanine amidase